MYSSHPGTETSFAPSRGVSLGTERAPPGGQDDTAAPWVQLQFHKSGQRRDEGPANHRCRLLTSPSIRIRVFKCTDSVFLIQTLMKADYEHAGWGTA